MPGTTTDSQSYLAAAKARGATAAIVYDANGMDLAASLGLAVALISDFQDSIWRICDAFYEHPSRFMKVVGVTGTNGKTTTAWLVRDMLQTLGVPTAYLGTLGFQLPDENRELSNTTPFAIELYSLIAEARDHGARALAMEVSSHALAERRVDGVEFDVSVFTNLTQDHLDFHGTMAEYEAAKWRLFSELPEQTEKETVAAINIDDPVGRGWAPRLPADRRIEYSLSGAGELRGRALEIGLDLIRMAIRRGEGPEIVGSAPLGGAYNVENLLSATVAVVALGYDLQDVVSTFESLRPVPGRFEPVPNEQRIGILVDYAHTPDAIEKLLQAVRPLTAGRITTVFGCGGDRDRNKRPKMAAAASALSDMTIVTSDNPRTEDPETILKDVVAGILPGRPAQAIIDRGEAIARAIELARAGDVVVIAGKGHENYQIIGRTKHSMDDRELARRGLGMKKNAPN
jgi:UDP-N-acetylmuramyl-tripeptide synthetase